MNRKGSYKKDEKKFIEIYEYNFQEQYPWSSFNCITGKRGTGKTSLAMHIAQSSPYAQTANYLVIAGAERARRRWSTIVHPNCVINPSLEHLQRLIDEGNDLVKKYGEEIPNFARVDIYIDDCGVLDWFMKSPQLAWLANNGRQIPFYRITICLQYIYMAPTVVREEFDTLLNLATNNLHCIKTFQKEYVSCKPLREFTAVLLKVTEKKGVLVIDNNQGGMVFEEICYFFRLPSSALTNQTIVGNPKIRAWLDSRNLDLLDELADDIAAEQPEDDDDVEEFISQYMQPHEGGDDAAYSDRFGRIIIRQIKHKTD